MKQEPKSIFTSQREFRPQPSDASALEASPPSIPVPVSSPTRQTTLHADQPQGKAADARGQPDIAADNSGVLSANAQVEDVSDGRGSEPFIQSTRGSSSSFRKPDIPSIQPSASITPRAENGLKHPRSESVERGPKRARPNFKLRHTLDPETFPTGFSSNTRDPPSPLFFSNTPKRQRPALLPSFSSSDAVTMLNKARDEAGGVTTLKLARGSISNSPTRSTSTPGSLTSLEKGSVSSSPDSKGKQSGLQILGNIGITELLEQDDRPTFIVDVANPVNFLPGAPLQIVFANASLRVYEVGVFVIFSLPIAEFNLAYQSLCSNQEF